MCAVRGARCLVVVLPCYGIPGKVATPVWLQGTYIWPLLQMLLYWTEKPDVLWVVGPMGPGP